MSENQIPWALIIGAIYHAFILIVGLVMMFFGYRLYLDGMKRRHEAAGEGVGQLKATLRSITLTKVAPGAVFALAGAAVAILGIHRGISVSIGGSQVSNEMTTEKSTLPNGGQVTPAEDESTSKGGGGEISIRMMKEE